MMEVSIADAGAPITSARVDTAGTYVFGIVASDGELDSVQKAVTVTVNEADGTVSYEAESPLNTRKGAGVYTMWSNGTPYEMVYDIGYAVNNTLQFNQIHVPEAGTYDLTFHYATEAGREMYANVSVNGGEPLTVPFAACPNWETLQTQTISVQLDQFDNTILFGGVDGLRAPNLDRITLVCRNQNPAVVTDVAVQPESAVVYCGSAQAFAAQVSGENDPVQTVTWTVSGNASAGTSINTRGILTVAGDETAKTLTVTATSTVDPSVSGSAQVTVEPLPPVTEDNIRLYYEFDGGSGNVVKDYSSQGVDGTLYGTVEDSNWSENGFAFTGNNYFKLTDADLVSPDMTIVYRVMRTGPVSGSCSFFWGMNQANWNGNGIWVNSSEDAPVFVATDGFVNFTTVGWTRDTFFPLNELVEVAITVNSGTGEYAIYRNGERCETTDVSGAHITVPTASYNTIGMAGYDNEFLQGFTMDKYMIFDRSLTKDDVKAVYEDVFAPDTEQDPICSADASVTVESERDAQNNAVFHVNLIDAKNVAAVQVRLEASDAVSITGENGFTYLDTDSKNGTMILCYLDQAERTFSAEGEVPVATIKISGARPAVKIDEVLIAAYDDAAGKPAYGEAVDLITAEAVFTGYDLNGDGTVDLLDTVTAMKFYRAQEGDENWENAQIADVDNDGVVTIRDFAMIALHFSN